MVALAATTSHNDLTWFLQRARPRRVGTLGDFAEREIVIPGHPFQGRLP